MAKNDVVIIGSGLGGLLCGYILAKEGCKVTILEKNKQLGGCLQTFKRRGSTFDTGVHYIGSMNQGQTLWRYFKYFGLTEKLKLKKLDENCFNKIYYNGSHYDYAQGYENFTESLSARFPDDKAAIGKYAETLLKISDSLNLYNLREASEQNLIESEYVLESVGEFLERLTPNSTLRSVLAGANSLYAGIPDKTSLYIHSLINHSYIQSAWRLIGGSSQIASLLVESIEAMGGTVRNSSEVARLDISGGRVVYAELSGGELVEGDIFISDVHPQTTLGLISQSDIRRTYRQRIMNVENTISNFTIYIKLKKNSFKYLNYNYYHHFSDNVWGAKIYSESDWPNSFMLLTPAVSENDEYADTLLLIAYMKYSDVEKWANTKFGKRGARYYEFKVKKAEIFLDAVETVFPGLRNSISHYYTSTPLTYRDYTGTAEGSLYGFLRDCKDPLKSYVPPKTKIPNLLLTGQNINMHGVLGVAIGSVLTCSELLGLNYLIGNINRASL
ncbi:MAG: NAD(P)/FAD-dependent oxidoreductase [Bacteroidota bacterium]|nr:NAD(P)/FAD-dependent oxidoreductase [Bacteroidota bacterium]